MTSWRMGWADNVARTGEKTAANTILVGYPTWKSRLRKCRYRMWGNIKMDFKEMRWEDVDWIQKSQDRDQWRALMNELMNLRVP